MTWNDLQRVRNDLKQPTMCKKRPEMTYHLQETTWNDLQRGRNSLKWSTSSKKQLETTHNKLDTIYNDLNKPTTRKEKMRNDQQQADFQIILQYGANGSLLLHFFHPTFGCSHLSIVSRRIMVKTECHTSIIMGQASIIMCIFYGI